MSSRKKSEVSTTMDGVCEYTAQIALNGITGTLVNSTDMATTVAGTNGGIVTVTLPENNRYPTVLGWEVSAQTNAAYAGTFSLHKVGYSATDGTFQFIVLSGSAPSTTLGTTGTPVNTTPGAVALTASLSAKVRNTNRTV